MNEQNLRLLATYLINAPIEPEAFHMEYFDEKRGAEPGLRPGIGRTDCGTVGCAVGHGPYAGIPKDIRESWTDYTARVFGIDLDGHEWDWCFDDDWTAVDNTPQGAGRRILYLLEHGLPADWRDQMEGDAPLSYEVPQ